MLDNLKLIAPQLPDSPIQHLMCLRLALIERLKHGINIDEVERLDLGNALTTVTNQLGKLGCDPRLATAPRGTQDAVRFYRNLVVLYWPLFRALLK